MVRVAKPPNLANHCLTSQQERRSFWKYLRESKPINFIWIYFLWKEYVREQAQQAKYSETWFFDSMLYRIIITGWRVTKPLISKNAHFSNTTNKFEPICWVFLWEWCLNWWAWQFMTSQPFLLPWHLLHSPQINMKRNILWKPRSKAFQEP